MSKLIQENPWVWVVVMDPGGNEQFLGQYYKEEGISFIPTFLNKEDALECLDYLTRDKEKKYEIQAIQYEELAHDATEHKFMLFVLNGAGEILDKITP
jgi:hypothetical protein